MIGINPLSFESCELECIATATGVSVLALDSLTLRLYLEDGDGAGYSVSPLPHPLCSTSLNSRLLFSIALLFSGIEGRRCE